MEYGSQQSFCSRCGSADQVRTIRDLFDMLNAMQDAAAAKAQQDRLSRRAARQPGSDWDSDPGSYDDPGQDIANAAFGVAAALIGRAIRKRVQRTFEEKVMPSLENQAAQARQDQDTIAARHPDLRGCLRDGVIFLAGGSSTIPISDIPMPVTATQADALVSRLRGF